MNKRYKRTPRRNPELYMMALLICGIGLYYLGVSTESITQLMILLVFMTFILYLVFRSLLNSWRDGNALFRFWKTRNLHDIDTMSGIQFERYVAQILKSKGFTEVRLTEYYDLGVDIIAQREGVTWGIQTKRYGSPVRADAVRQAYTALNRYKCHRAMVITNSTFTNPARLLAKDNDIILIDRDVLSKWINDKAGLI